MGDWVPFLLLSALLAALAARSCVKNAGWGAGLGLAIPPLLGLGAGLALAGRAQPPRDVFATIRARQWAYEPATLRVHRGDHVHLTLFSQDVTHGFHLDGHPIDVELEGGGRPVNVELVARSVGRFVFRCSRTCGSFHPFMTGTLVVEPNYLFAGSLGLALGLFIAALGYVRLQGESAAARHAPSRLDLLARFPRLGSFLRRREPWRAVFLFTLGMSALLMSAAFVGPPVGSRNISTVFVWILWWFMLLAVLVPFAGRAWCAVCPFPVLGEWLQRGSLAAGGANAGWCLNLRWPQRLRNMWLQVFVFMALALLSPLLVTRPIATGLALGGLWLLCTALMLVYEKRSFCVYLCPVSGFQGLYSLLAPIEVRPRDDAVCRAHRGAHGCALGARAGDGLATGGWGCPWLQRPERLRRNALCGLCLECIRGCQRDNMTIKLRPWGSDFVIQGLDEAWKALLLLALAAVYAVTLLGPNGRLKDWINPTWTGDWRSFAAYAATAAAVCLALFPALHAVFAWASRELAAGANAVAFRDVFVRYSYVWVPMGLFAWLAFSLPLAMTHWTYVLAAASDPFGWGWDLFGTARAPWRPVAAQTMPYLQSLLLMPGLVCSVALGYDVSGLLWKDPATRWRSLLPMAAALLLTTIGFATLFAA